MPKSPTPARGLIRVAEDETFAVTAPILDLDDVAQRRERLAAYAALTQPVVTYRFAMPHGATVASFAGGQGAPRDARAQLDLVVGLTGGAVSRRPEGVAARIPKVLAGRFEAMAGPLIEAYLVAIDLGEEAA